MVTSSCVVIVVLFWILFHARDPGLRNPHKLRITSPLAKTPYVRLRRYDSAEAIDPLMAASDLAVDERCSTVRDVTDVCRAMGWRAGKRKEGGSERAMLITHKRRAVRDHHGDAAVSTVGRGWAWSDASAAAVEGPGNGLSSDVWHRYKRRGASSSSEPLLRVYRTALGPGVIVFQGLKDLYIQAARPLCSVFRRRL